MMKTMKKISLWMMSLLTLLFVAGCAEQKPEQTTAETTTETDSPFSQKSFVEAPAETKFESDDTLDTPPFFRRRNRN